MLKKKAHKSVRGDLYFNSKRKKAIRISYAEFKGLVAIFRILNLCDAAGERSRFEKCAGSVFNTFDLKRFAFIWRL